jgi:hypothetical protein
MRSPAVPDARSRSSLLPLRGTLALTLGALAAVLAPPPASAAPRPRPSVLVVFVSAGERQLAAIPGMSVGIMSATQGACPSAAQMLLDAGQGVRVGCADYPRPLAALEMIPLPGGGARIGGWGAARRLSARVSGQLSPGLLATAAGGGAYAGQPQSHGRHVDALLVAGRSGRVGLIALGPPASLLGRVSGLLRRSALVVADLPGGPAGIRDLLALARSRRAGELLLALQDPARGAGGELLWAGAAGLPGGGGRELTSATTQEEGMISAVDLAPTILDHLGRAPVPAMIGRPIRAGSSLDLSSLKALVDRLRTIGGRRLPALATLLAGWGLLLLLAAAQDRRGARGAGRTGWGARALRLGALAMLWTPAAALVPGALDPSPAVEYALLAGLCFGLAAITDAALPWPRAPIAPAAVACAAITADALAGAQLLVRSLLGPDPLGGSRFYGIGNELKATLAVLALAGIAAALYPARRGRAGALALAAGGTALGVIEGSARIGAGVGGVVLVSLSFALAAGLLLPGGLDRRRALLALCAPVAALGALAALDLTTAHGVGHFTATVLDGRMPLGDTLERRYTGAWHELDSPGMLLATAVALLACVLLARHRAAVLAPVQGDPGWWAALAGGLAAGMTGSLVEDSGPLLLLTAVGTLACVCAYLHGRPPRPVLAGRAQRRRELSA